VLVGAKRVGKKKKKRKNRGQECIRKKGEKKGEEKRKVSLAVC